MTSALAICSKSLHDHRVCELESELFLYKRYVAWKNAVASIDQISGESASTSPLGYLMMDINLKIVKCSCNVCVHHWPGLSDDDTTNYSMDRDNVLQRILTDPREINLNLELLVQKQIALSL